MMLSQRQWKNVLASNLEISEEKDKENEELEDKNHCIENILENSYSHEQGNG